MADTQIKEALARGYCTDRNSKKVLDPDLIEDMAIEIGKLPQEPYLGCATTKELLEEIKARIEIDGKLEYRTIDNN